MTTTMMQSHQVFSVFSMNIMAICICLCICSQPDPSTDYFNVQLFCCCVGTGLAFSSWSSGNDRFLFFDDFTFVDGGGGGCCSVGVFGGGGGGGGDTSFSSMASNCSNNARIVSSASANSMAVANSLAVDMTRSALHKPQLKTESGRRLLFSSCARSRTTCGRVWKLLEASLEITQQRSRMISAPTQDMTRFDGEGGGAGGSEKCRGGVSASLL